MDFSHGAAIAGVVGRIWPGDHPKEATRQVLRMQGSGSALGLRPRRALSSARAKFRGCFPFPFPAISIGRGGETGSERWGLSR